MTMLWPWPDRVARAKIEGQDAFQLPMSGGPPSDRDTYWMVSIAS
jgi:hypothetical protein